MMIRKATCGLMLAAAFAVAGQASADLASYSQDFEGLDAMSGSALGDDGWLVGANVFEAGAGANGEGAFLYNYFAFPAPNGSGAFSNVTDMAGGAPVGSQGLVVFSDYNNGDHGATTNRLESIFFREYTVGAADVGSTWEFTFTAAPGDLAGTSSAQGFIKTLDPDAGFSVSNFVTADTTSLPAGNSVFTLELAITADLEGQILQVGFDNWASEFAPSGVNYDNISFNVVPEPGSLALLGLGGLALLRRRH